VKGESVTTRRSNGGTVIFGRHVDDWEELVTAATDWLEDRARLRLTTTYTELNNALVERTGQAPFDFGQTADRAAMGHLLGTVSERKYPEIRCMLTAIVPHRDGTGPGSGFYLEAQKLGLLPRTVRDDEQLSFWVQQVERVFDAYR
jgi:hypothetical protein